MAKKSDDGGGGVPLTKAQSASANRYTAQAAYSKAVEAPVKKARSTQEIWQEAIAADRIGATAQVQAPVNPFHPQVTQLGPSRGAPVSPLPSWITNLPQNIINTIGYKNAPPVSVNSPGVLRTQSPPWVNANQAAYPGTGGQYGYQPTDWYNKPVTNYYPGTGGQYGQPTPTQAQVSSAQGQAQVSSVRVPSMFEPRPANPWSTYDPTKDASKGFGSAQQQYSKPFNNYSTSMSYPGYNGPVGPDVYTSFGQLQPPPFDQTAANAASAARYTGLAARAKALAAKTTAKAGYGSSYGSSFKKGGGGGGGWGGYGSGGYSSDYTPYAPKAYEPSAWASLVGWNINR